MKYIILFTAICIWSLSSCRPKGDYNSPFYKMYDSESDIGRYTIHLTRHIAATEEYDSVSDKFAANEKVWYSGVIIDKNTNGDPVAISASHALGEKDLYLTYYIGKADTMGLFSIRISGDGKILEGWNGKRVASQNKNLPDSIPFKAIEIQPSKITFKLHSETGTKKLFDSIENSPTLDYSFIVLEPVATEIDSNLFKKIRKGIYGIYHISDTVTDPLQAVIKYRSDELFSSHKNDKPEDYTRDNAFFIRSSISRTMQVVTNTAYILSVVMNEDDYSSGAAHNLYSSSHYNFNLQNGELLHLSDVLNNEGYRRISNLITQKIRQQNGLRPGQSLRDADYFSNAVKFNNNFFINEYGIGFYYNIYEIASFASGETRVFIPFSELEGCLRPFCLELINGKQG